MRVWLLAWAGSYDYHPIMTTWVSTAYRRTVDQVVRDRMSGRDA
jgi:hypothetical protein